MSTRQECREYKAVGGNPSERNNLITKACGDIIAVRLSSWKQENGFVFVLAGPLPPLLDAAMELLSPTGI